MRHVYSKDQIIRQGISFTCGFILLFINIELSDLGPIPQAPAILLSQPSEHGMQHYRYATLSLVKYRME